MLLIRHRVASSNYKTFILNQCNVTHHFTLIFFLFFSINTTFQKIIHHILKVCHYNVIIHFKKMRLLYEIFGLKIIYLSIKKMGSVVNVLNSNKNDNV
jgi:hypothetical protein